MRLKQLKLAGFKSFVDPTVISLTGNLSAVVGPNGCGKSNIIDAVRWVLGESSAKNLRGEGMTDVIFNGSNARKPVSQASVELTFINDQNKIVGLWQSYSEIAIKRLVNRDGQSDYFINNQKCRRRDISDLLSGTGLGPRSYAIIEQGTISKLVESKPQELRVFIEEAAGITKYKERRRESENRIKHSRENLSRLNDLNFELTSQVDSLESQAKDAEHYGALKSQEKTLQQDIVVKRWKDFSLELGQALKKLDQNQRTCVDLDAQLDTQSTQTSNIETQVSELSSKQIGLTKQCFEIEASVAQHSAEVKILEQAQRQDLNQQEELLVTRQSNNVRLQNQKERVEQLQTKISQLLPQLPIAQTQLIQVNELCSLTSQQLEHTTNQLTSHQHQHVTLGKQLDLVVHSRAKLLQDQHKLQSQIELLKGKLEGYSQQRHAINVSSKIETYQLAKYQHQESIELVKKLADQVNATGTEVAEVNSLLRAVENTIFAIENRITTNNMLIESKLIATGTDVQAMYAGHSQLWQELTIDDGWHHSVEVVLGQFLQAYCVDSLVLNTSDHSHLIIEKSQASFDKKPFKMLPSLLSHVASDYAIEAILTGVYCASDINQATAIVSQLTIGQSVITPEGHWFGAGYAAINVVTHQDQSALGLTQLQQNLQVDIKHLTESQHQQSEVNANLATLKHRKQAEDQSLAHAIAKDKSLEQQVNDTKQQWLLEQQHGEHLNSQYIDAEHQIKELTKIEQLEQQQIAGFDLELTTKNKTLSKLEQTVNDHDNNVRKLQNQLSKNRQQYQLSQQDKHDIELAIQKQQIQCEAALVQLQEFNDTVTNNDQQLDQLKIKLQSKQQPLAEQRHTLTNNQQRLVKLQLVNQTTQQQLTQLIKQQQQAQQDVNQGKLKLTQIQSVNNRLNLNCETLKVKLNAQQQVLELSESAIGALADQLTEVDDAKSWPQQLLDVKQQLAQIGPINLTAINQYNEQKQRSEQLTAQIDDLEQALQTLELAIKKIDRQSREKFKLTFDAVNHDFQKLFPQVFGGGSAQLT
ncbi:MAG: chromosome segregation protein SMC, partial [Gammaproteobacteria bacterium]|nr:chromosome segregation protein SMC [Gammaproteobacteria bacterium]